MKKNNIFQKLLIKFKIKKIKKQKQEEEGPKVIWQERSNPQPKKIGKILTFSFHVRPAIVMLVVCVIVSLFAGAISGFYASTYAFTKFVGYLNKPALPNLLLEKSHSRDSNNSSSLEEGDIVSAVENVSPSVVSIVVSKHINETVSKDDWLFDDLFDHFFFKNTELENNQNNKEGQERRIGGGTGFVVSSEEGLILTNKHVINISDANYTVIDNQGKEYEAELLAQDPFNDLAILKVDSKDLIEVVLGDSDQIQIGQTVVAIGNALGEYNNTVTKGIISGIGRKVVAGGQGGVSEILEDVIQTDAAINFGNSGGPLINIKGEVVGINTAVSKEGQLIAFAIPINQTKSAIESVKNTGKIVRPFLGVRYIIINSEIAQENNLSVNYGALIIRGDIPSELAIIPGSPADKANLVENDIILEVNGQKIGQDYSLARAIQQYEPGEKITLKILHKGVEKIVKIILEEYQK